MGRWQSIVFAISLLCNLIWLRQLSKQAGTSIHKADYGFRGLQESRTSQQKDEDALSLSLSTERVEWDVPFKGKLEDRRVTFDTKGDDAEKDRHEGTESAIFYNIFIPKDFVQRTHNLVLMNQRKQIVESGFLNATLYYNNFGERSLRPLCPKAVSKCEMLRYAPEGNEVDTLQDLYDYCWNNAAHTVAYIHSKGSFNFKPSNQKIRRLATKASLSKECLRMTSLGCNTCALRVMYLPNLHSIGNMWSAQCSYIRKLIPPKDYEKQRRQMFEDVRNSPTHSTDFPCFVEGIMERNHTDRDEYVKMLSVDRYASENWVWSHPDVTPCHVLTLPLGRLGDGTVPWDPVLRRGTGFANPHIFEDKYKLNMFLRKGRLWQMGYLYNGSVPPDENWFWDIFHPRQMMGQEFEISNCSNLYGPPNGPLDWSAERQQKLKDGWKARKDEEQQQRGGSKTKTTSEVLTLSVGGSASPKEAEPKSWLDEVELS